MAEAIEAKKQQIAEIEKEMNEISSVQTNTMNFIDKLNSIIDGKH